MILIPKSQASLFAYAKKGTDKYLLAIFCGPKPEDNYSSRWSLYAKLGISLNALDGVVKFYNQAKSRQNHNYFCIECICNKLVTCLLHIGLYFDMSVKQMLSQTYETNIKYLTL